MTTTTTAAPLAQLRPAHPALWDAVYAADAMTMKQALSAALLGHVDVARQIIEAGPTGSWAIMEWPDLTAKAEPTADEECDMCEIDSYATGKRVKCDECREAEERAAADYDARALVACEAVAALLPGTDTTDDGGGPYITTDDAEEIELFVLRPEDAQEPDHAWHWQFQHNNAEPQVVERSELTILSAPEDVAAWARTVMPATA